MVYFSQLANSMTTFTVRGFAEIAECMVSIRRIQVPIYAIQLHCKNGILIQHEIFRDQGKLLLK